MPFGLRNAPTFQAIMNRVFHPFLQKFVLGFMDDIMIYSRTLDNHVGHLTTVLVVLREHQLVANKKCHFALKQIEYLGHIVLGEGVSADPSKLVVMEQWLIPHNLKKR